MDIANQTSNVPDRIRARMGTEPRRVWTPVDFADIGRRDAVDKALQRMVAQGELRRIERGLYDTPSRNPLTGKDTAPDYRAIIEAISRRDQVRWVVDGMTAANTLGLTNAVPARIEVLVDARLKPISIGKQQIIFKQAAASRLYWAGRPAMYLVQALRWLHDVITHPAEKAATMKAISRLLGDPDKGPTLIADLQAGYSAMPIWMQDLLRDLLFDHREDTGTWA